MTLRLGLYSGVLIALAGCSAIETLGPNDLTWVDGTRTRWNSGRGALQMRWSQRLVPVFDDAYLPVEHGTPAVDAERDRVYAGTTTGLLWALAGNGRRLYRYDAGASFEAGPTIDPLKNELYAVTEDGVVHALNAQNGAQRWKVDSGAGATRRPLLLVPDAIYVVSDTDHITALARADGEILWRYKREPTEGYHVVGHAGLTLNGTRLFAAFSDGMVVALDPSDGQVLWERDTALDFPPGETGTGQRFLDVDTTPVVLDSTLYVASFSGGLYGLDVASGSVTSQRSDLTGITSIVVTPAGLLLANADGSLSCVTPEGELVWKRRVSRGTPSEPTVRGDIVFVSETGGGFIALQASNGVELSRVEAGHGFSAAPAFAERRGFVLSNGGTLYAFTLP